MYDTLSFFVTTLYQDFRAYSGQRLKELGLNFGQLPFIICIGKRPGCTPSEVTKQLHMDWGHSQRSITKLETDGFLRKERSSPNARVCRLYLTALGQQAFETCHEVFRTWDEAHLSALAPEELQQLTETLRKLKASCTKKGDSCEL